MNVEEEIRRIKADLAGIPVHFGGNPGASGNFLYRTISDDEHPYPDAEDQPRKYWAKKLKVFFDKDGESDVALDVEQTDSKAWIYCRSGAYILEDTDVPCYRMNGQLYTEYNPLRMAQTTEDNELGGSVDVEFLDDSGQLTGQRQGAINDFSTVPTERTVYVQMVNGKLRIVAGDPCG